MKRLSRWLLAPVIWGMLTPAALAQSSDYLLRAGDTINVTVVAHPELSVQNQIVRPDGKISLPLVDELPVGGKTVREASANLARAYQAFLARPQVVVNVAKYRPLRVTVIGQVGRPGTFDFEDGPTLVSALAVAGGLTERASRGEILVSRNGTATTYDLDKVLAGKTPMPALQDGSLVDVRETWVPDLYRVTVPLSAALITAVTLIVTRR